MKRQYGIQIALALIFVLTVAGVGAGQQVGPITGDWYERFLGAQNTPLQNYLRSVLTQIDGCDVFGPLDPTRPVELLGYDEVRVICDSLSTAKAAVEQLRRQDSVLVRTVTWFLDRPARQAPYAFRGAIVDFENGPSVSVTTINQTRFLIWAERTLLHPKLEANRNALQEYAVAVSNYLYALDKGFADADPPLAIEYELHKDIDFYADPPGYVIEGYQNYKDYLNAHAAISTDYASGVLSFVPGDSLLRAFMKAAPEALFPNKEAPMLQHEYREFLQRGGDIGIMQTLTRRGFDSLQAGEYFFAVGANGTIRFGRELLREDVNRIEQETGDKVPRGNHAFLFPGEPLLTAGAFFIETEDSVQVVEVNAQSGHYFYSNVTPTIRDDIAVRSDYYLSTLGHFFTALDSLDIPYNRVLITKL